MADVAVQRPVRPKPRVVGGSTGRRGLESPWWGAVVEAQREGRREACAFQLLDRVHPSMLPSFFPACLPLLFLCVFFLFFDWESHVP